MRDRTNQRELQRDETVSAEADGTGSGLVEKPEKRKMRYNQESNADVAKRHPVTPRMAVHSVRDQGSGVSVSWRQSTGLRKETKPKQDPKDWTTVHSQNPELKSPLGAQLG